MQTFLQETAKDILQKYGNQESVCVVFPNKRSLSFFRKAYAEAVGATSFSGNFFTINKIIKQLSGYFPLEENSVKLLFTLYDAFYDVFKDSDYNASLASGFDKFFDTGNKLLKDFNEIDNYLIDIDQLCTNFADIAEIDAFYSNESFSPEQIDAIKTFWANFSPDRLSKEKLRYQELWINLPRVHKLFVQKLTDNRTGYSGMINRMICQKIDNGSIIPKYKTYVFVGFNALNKAERKIFSWFRQNGSGHFYWDSDEYYINDHAQEAGLFMRRYLIDYPDDRNPKPPSNILTQPKNVEYIGVPLSVAQAKAVYGILDDYAHQEDFVPEKTAVILGDEHLLFPVLNSLPESIGSVNVTMGYPFKETPVYSLLSNCIALRKNLRGKGEKSTFYYKDVTAVLQHPLICNLPGVNSKIITDTIVNNRMIRVYAKLFEPECQLLKLIFCFPLAENAPTDILFQLMNVLSEYFFIKNPNPKPENNVENEYIYNAYIKIKSLYNVLIENCEKYQLSDELVLNLLRQNLDSVSVAFDSESVGNSVQIMGMIESRNIDFDNIIMLGINEGVFPKTSENDSFITEGMRMAFDMPVLKYKDAIFAYFFYRLFQRAKNIKVLYNNVFGQSTSGELSRFATQIQKEASNTYRADSKLSITEREFMRQIKPSHTNNVNVENNEDSRNILKRYLANDFHNSKLSPSALSTYLDCPLKFYFQYIARLTPEAEVEEDISPADFGTILHTSVETLYTQIKGADGLITAQALNVSEPIVEQHIINAYNQNFKQKLKDKESLEGFHKIFFEIVKQYLGRIIEYDKIVAPFNFLAAEQNAYCPIDVTINGLPEKVWVGGKLDRLDIDRNGNLRIVDYKTGNTAKKMKFNTLADLFDDSQKMRRPIAFQLLFYSYVYMRKHPDLRPTPAVYAVRNTINEKDTYLSADSVPVNGVNIKQLTDEFAEYLQQLINEIFNCEKFEPKPNDYCKYCDFYELCNAEK